MTHTAGELAEYLGAKLTGDSRAAISGVASPERARAEDLIYADSPRHLARAAQSRAKCALVLSGMAVQGKILLEVKDAKFAFAKSAGWILPRAAAISGIHPTAIVAATARLGSEISVGAYVVIEDGAEIGSGAVVEAFCCVGRGSRIGDNSWLHPRVTLYPGVRLGNRVEIHAGAVIGADGFGYVFGEGRHWKFPQIGGVEIGDDVEIGANTTIDRGALDDTCIAEGVKIDNLVQIAHNVRIGDHSVIAAQTGVSGSSTLGKRVVMGGQVGIGDHCTIEDGATVGGQAGILPGKTIYSGQIVWGTPARELDRFKEQYAWYARLPEMAKRLRKLEQEKKGE